MTHRTSTRTVGVSPAARVLGAAVLAVVLVAGLAGLNGCTPAGTKAGPDRPVTVLRLAVPESRGTPTTKDVELFADRVADLTDGAVRIEIDYEVIPWTPASEQAITRMVQTGKTDLAFVAPRVFDTVGVTGFQALQTPMLIDTPELAGAVATGEVAAGMLAGLDDQGLVGLGLVYEGLRRPMALNGAVTRATDLEGLTIRVPLSGVSDRVFEALGAVPDNGDSHTVSTSGERYPVVETELALAGTDFPSGSTVTANLVLFPKYDAILANPDALGRLSQDQRDAVRQATAEAVAGAVQTTSDEEALAATYCMTAGDLLSAPLGEVRAMRARLQPVVDELREDPATAAVIDEIGRLEVATAAPRFRSPPACSTRTGDGALLPSVPAAPTP